MFKKYMSVILALVIVMCITGCDTDKPNDPTTGESTVATNPGSDTGGVDPGTTEPDPTVPTDPVDPSVPADPSEPTGPVDPVDPTDPTEPSEPDVPEHQHIYAEEVTEATCTEDGFTTYTCECGDTYTGSKVTATGHTWSEWVTIEEPTQTTTGLAGRNCTVCGEKETKELAMVIPDHTHSYTGEVTKAATCTAEGVKTFTCSCGNSYTENISKISHSYKGTVTKPTCTTKGYTTYKCSFCGDTYMDIYVAATGHKFGTYTSNGDATCTQDGTKTATCSNGCGKKNTVTDTGSAKGHSYKETVTAPTCTAKGYTTYKCGTCGDSYKGSYVAAAGHNYGTYASNGDATCTKDGTKTATCSACGTKDTVTDVGSTVDHNYVVIKTVESFITGPGYQQYECSFCQDAYTESLPEWTEEECVQFLRDVEDAIFKYICQFREEEGETPATHLPGMHQVAQYRAMQLQSNYAHDELDIREAHNYFEYGKYCDNTAFGGTAYYTSNGTEAIASVGAGTTNADELGYKIASLFRNSASHWRYLKMSWYEYMAVGVDWSYAMQFTICVMVSSENYG